MLYTYFLIVELCHAQYVTSMFSNRVYARVGLWNFTLSPMITLVE